MKDFVVIWNHTMAKFIEYDEAVEYAQYKTKGEERHNTALIIMREVKGADVKIPLMLGCSWIAENIFELVNLTM